MGACVHVFGACICNWFQRIYFSGIMVFTSFQKFVSSLSSSREDQIPLAVSAPCPISSVTVEFWFDVFVVVMKYR